MMVRSFWPVGALVASALAFMLTGCASENPRGFRSGTAGAPMTSSGELATPDPKPMDAQGLFFAGQVEAEAMLAKSDVAWKTPNPSDPAHAGGRGGRGGEGGFSAGLGGGRRGGGGGRRGEGGEGETAARPTGADAPRGPAMRATNAPPVQLRLRLTNIGAEAATVEVLDFNSDLGNFVVLPATIALPPGQPVEAEPMTSRLGVPAVEEIPVTVRLRMGGKSGKTETQILKLRPRVDPALEQK